MVSAKHKLLWLETRVSGDLFSEGTEIGWLHPGISAHLVDLIARRFYKQKTSICYGLLCCGAQDQRMRRTHRIDSRLCPIFSQSEMVLEDSAHLSGRS
jgi:hypothetical protein